MVELSNKFKIELREEIKKVLKIEFTLKIEKIEKINTEISHLK